VLADDGTIADLAGEIRGNHALWGVATGAAVSDWLRSVLPTGQLLLDWDRTFQEAKGLAYAVDRDGEGLTITVELKCATVATATALSQVLAALKTIQGMAWRDAHPQENNPFENASVKVIDQSVTLSLEVENAADGAGILPLPRNN
jgi:hypothetical protein